MTPDLTPPNVPTAPAARQTPVPPARTPRWVLVLIAVLAGGIVGGVGGLLAHAESDSVPSAILTGGGAFAGTVLLLLAILHFADPR